MNLLIVRITQFTSNLWIKVFPSLKSHVFHNIQYIPSAICYVCLCVIYVLCVSVLQIENIVNSPSTDFDKIKMLLGRKKNEINLWKTSAHITYIGIYESCRISRYFAHLSITERWTPNAATIHFKLNLKYQKIYTKCGNKFHCFQIYIYVDVIFHKEKKTNGENRYTCLCVLFYKFISCKVGLYF